MAKAGILGTAEVPFVSGRPLDQYAEVQAYKVPSTGVSFSVVDVHVSPGISMGVKTATGTSCWIGSEIIVGPPVEEMTISAFATRGSIVRKVVLGPGESVVVKRSLLDPLVTGRCTVYGIEHV